MVDASQTANSTLIFPDGRNIVQAERKIVYYLDRFGTYPRYDAFVPSSLNVITADDRHLANQLAARRGASAWAPLVGQSIETISENWDLLRMSDRTWEYAQSVTRQVLSPLLTVRGIRIASLTKALHRKRPDFIPVCDAILLNIFGVEIDTKQADSALELMNGLRQIGLLNTGVLERLAAETLRMACPLSELRILDALCWVEWGPFSE